MRYLTKSRFKEALECPDKLFYSGKRKEYADTRDDNEFLRELAKGGMQVGELAKCYFPEGIEVETLDIEVALQRTQELMQKENVTIFEAAIAYGNLLVRVDVLVKKGNTLNLYEAKSKSYFDEDEIFTKNGDRIKELWKPYVYDIAFQVFVARKAFPDYTVYGSLFLIDKNTTCTVDGLFQKFLVRKVNNRYKVVSNSNVKIGTQILGKVDLGTRLDDILLGTMDLLGESISFEAYVTKLADAYAADKKLNIPLSSECKGCTYKATDEEKNTGKKSGYEECWMAKANLKQPDFKKPHVFEVWSLKSADFIMNGRYFIADLTQADLEPKTPSKSKRLISPSERQWLQVERVQNPSLGSYFDKFGFNDATRKLTYPLHFIDFEATRNAIPYLKGLRPYAQLAFQFSHHTLKPNGDLIHYGWIHPTRGTNPNFDFLRELKKQLDQDSGSVMMYSSYENSVLLSIYDYLRLSDEHDKDVLIKFIESITVSKNTKEDSTRGEWQGPRSMVDMKDWIMDFYYSPAMKGSNSIKAVVPAILQESKFVQAKYPEWVKISDGLLINPYELLPPVFDDIDRLSIEPLMEESEIADGGAAMCAFNLMQFSEMTDLERTRIRQALLKYCELDTLAMVMLFEGLLNLNESKG